MRTRPGRPARMCCGGNQVRASGDLLIRPAGHLEQLPFQRPTGQLAVVAAGLRPRCRVITLAAPTPSVRVTRGQSDATLRPPGRNRRDFTGKSCSARAGVGQHQGQRTGPEPDCRPNGRWRARPAASAASVPPAAPESRRSTAASLRPASTSRLSTTPAGRTSRRSTLPSVRPRCAGCPRTPPSTAPSASTQSVRATDTAPASQSFPGVADLNTSLWPSRAIEPAPSATQVGQPVVL